MAIFSWTSSLSISKRVNAHLLQPIWVEIPGNSVHNIKTHQRQAIVKNPFAKVIKTPWNINSNAFKI